MKWLSHLDYGLSEWEERRHFVGLGVWGIRWRAGVVVAEICGGDWV